MEQKIPTHVIREALIATKGRYFYVDEFLSSLILGLKYWDYCFIGWAYIKCVDDIIDKEKCTETAKRFIRAQKKFINEIYSNICFSKPLTAPEIFGYYIIKYDIANNFQLQSLLWSIIEEIEFDIDRRNKLISKKDLNKHALKIGEATIKYAGHFISPDLIYPQSFIEKLSLAYIGADSLMDLEEDFDVGIINISKEDIDQYNLFPLRFNRSLQKWILFKSNEVLDDFNAAFNEIKLISNRSLKILSYLYVSRKKKKFKNYLKQINSISKRRLFKWRSFNFDYFHLI